MDTNAEKSAYDTQMEAFIQQHLKEDAETAQRALGILEAYFTKTGLALEDKPMTGWLGFCIYLNKVLLPLIKEGRGDTWIRDLLNEVFEFALQNPTPSGMRSADLLVYFVGSDLERVKPLLTAQALGQLEEARRLLDAQHESYMRYAEQASY